MTIDPRLSTALADRYRIERELGQGGMATVYLAQDLKHDRRVAVKVLRPELAAVLGAERFLAEIRVTANLQHPNLLPLFDSGAVTSEAELPSRRAAEFLFYVMPYVEGETLRARLERERQLPVDDVVRMVGLLANALDYAHAQGVIHRDLKPENILLQSGQPVIADFGIALAVAQAGGSRVTETGLSLGTPHYMSPEQAAGGREIDARSDQYALGAVTYEMLSGEPPHTGPTGQVIIARLMTEKVRSLRATRPGIPAAMDRAVQRALARTPADRFASCSALARGLMASPAHGKRGLVVAASLGALAVVVIGARLMIADRGSAAATTSSDQKAIAVLPIENLGGDSATEYLADGMTSELSSTLAKLPGLQVTGDLSTFRFKGTHTAPAEIARQLGVHLLLTGKLQSGQGRIRLQMQLSDPAGRLLWSNTFDRETRDNFALQDEITSAIATEMRLVLSPATLAVTRAGRTVNPEAHDLYMRGQFEKNKLSPQGLERALVYFNQALKLDPDYAQAHFGVGFVYDIQADVYAPSHEYHMLALDAARRAVKADSLLAEARVLYGYELASAEWDFPAGRAEMERGLALNPRSPDGLFMAAMFALITGDNSRALALVDRLIQVDPLSALAARMKAEVLFWGGRYQEALRQSAEADQLDPTVIFVESTEGHALRELGRFDESVAAFLEFEKTFDRPTFGLALTYARMGKPEAAMKAIQALEARERSQWVDPDFIAIAYAGIGDRDHAMDWLEKAFQVKAFSLRAFMNWDNPWLHSMKDDPRYIALQKKVLATTFRTAGS